MRYKLVIFDLDGTLLSTGADLAWSVNLALAHNGLAVIPEHKVFEFIGNGSFKLIERAVGNADADIERVHEDYKQFYLDHCTDSTFPFDGIEDLLSDLHKAGIKTAVNTNKPEQATFKVLQHCLPGRFDLIVAQSDIVPRKPDPTGVNMILDHFGFPPGDCCYIGDSDVDIRTARNAGINCISVDWGFKTRNFLENSGADVICSSCEELRSELFA